LFWWEVFENTKEGLETQKIGNYFFGLDHFDFKILFVQNDLSESAQTTIGSQA
jgi:hypothetical protein